MAETFFDPRTGKLIVGGAAANDSAAEMGDYDYDAPPDGEAPAGTASLPALLASKQPPYQPGQYGPTQSERNRTPQVTRESVEQLGAWVLKMVQAAGAATLKGVHLDRAHLLGLAPSRRTVEKLVSMPDLRESLGAPPGYAKRQEAPNWLRKTWQRYAQKVDMFVNKGRGDNRRKPTEDDYKKYEEERGGLSLWQIRAAGGLNWLNSQAGYPNPDDWDEHTVLRWGSQVYEANPGYENYLTRYDIDTLSARGMGPSTEKIARLFGSYATFQKRVQQYMAHKPDEARRQASLDRYDQITGGSPGAEGGPTERHRLAYVAKYDLANKLLDRADPEVLRYLAGLNPAAFLEELKQRNPNLTAGDIELEAEMDGVMDDIWTPPTSKIRLDRLRLGKRRRKKDSATDEQSNPQESSGGGSGGGASIDDVMTVLQQARSEVGDSSGAIQQAKLVLENAQALFIREVEGDGSYEVQEVIGMYATAINMLEEAQQQVEAAGSSIEGVRARL